MAIQQEVSIGFAGYAAVEDYVLIYTDSRNLVFYADEAGCCQLGMFSEECVMVMGKGVGGGTGILFRKTAEGPWEIYQGAL